MNNYYQEGEPKQEIQITLRFNVKMNPGTEEHLKQVAINHIIPKGLKIYEENGKLIME